MDALALRQTNATTAESHPMKSIFEKLITALEETDAELSRLRKDRRDSWSKDPINELVAEARAALDAPVLSQEHPTIAECEAAGKGPDNYPGKPFEVGGNPDTPEERARFEAYMKGHCWDFGNYSTKDRAYDTVTVRCLYGVWKDRGLLGRARPAPEGFVLVPIEPTDEMSDSAWRGFQDADFSYLRSKLSLHDVRRVFVMFYKAMIAATERNKP